MLHTSRVCFDQILANGPHTNTIHPLQSISLCRPVGRHAPQVSPLELPKLFPSFGDKLGSATKLWQPPFCGSGCWEHVALWQDLHVQGLGFGAHLRLSGLCCGIWKCRRFKSLAVESTLEPWSRLKRPPPKKNTKLFGFSRPDHGLRLAVWNERWPASRPCSAHPELYALLGGSWVVTCGVISPLIQVISIVILLKTPLGPTYNYP